MRRLRLAVSIALLTLAAVPGTGAAASLVEDLQQSWARQKVLLMRTADAMPEASFDSRPTPEQRTFGEQILHVAGANTFLMGFTGAKTQGPRVDTSNLSTFGLQAKTRAEILAALEASFDHGIAALAELGDEDMIEEVQGPPWVGKVTRAAMVSFILGHNMDIYGQMVVYLRLEGIVPPASRR